MFGLIANCSYLRCAFIFLDAQSNQVEATMKQEPDTMKQGQQPITNRRNFLVSSAAAAGLILYPETLLFGQAAGTPAAPHDRLLKDRHRMRRQRSQSLIR